MMDESRPPVHNYEDMPEDVLNLIFFDDGSSELAEMSSDDEDSEDEGSYSSGTTDNDADYDDDSDDEVGVDAPFLSDYPELQRHLDSLQESFDSFGAERQVGHGPRADDEHSIPSLWSVSSSSEEGDRPTPDPISVFSTPPSSNDTSRSIRIMREFVSSLVAAEMLRNSETPSDPTRALILLQGLEPVSDTLAFRYQKLRGGDGPDSPVTCAICRENLVESFHDSTAHDEEAAKTNVSHSIDLPFHLPHHSILTFPCHHLFHWNCLKPWLAQKTTCPTCRFDIDPLSLTLNTQCERERERWQAPNHRPLSAWLDDEEASLHDKRAHSETQLNASPHLRAGEGLPHIRDNPLSCRALDSEAIDVHAIASTSQIRPFAPSLRNFRLRAQQLAYNSEEEREDSDFSDFQSATSSLGSCSPSAPMPTLSATVPTSTNEDTQKTSPPPSHIVDTDLISSCASFPSQPAEHWPRTGASSTGRPPPI